MQISGKFTCLLQSGKTHRKTQKTHTTGNNKPANKKQTDRTLVRTQATVSYSIIQRRWKKAWYFWSDLFVLILRFRLLICGVICVSVFGLVWFRKLFVRIIPAIQPTKPHNIHQHKHTFLPSPSNERKTYVRWVVLSAKWSNVPNRNWTIEEDLKLSLYIEKLRRVIMTLFRITESTKKETFRE